MFQITDFYLVILLVLFSFDFPLRYPHSGIDIWIKTKIHPFIKSFSHIKEFKFFLIGARLTDRQK